MRDSVRGGERLNDLVGQKNPWVSETCCERQNYHNCQGRYEIMKQEEEKS